MSIPDTLQNIYSIIVSAAQNGTLAVVGFEHRETKEPVAVLSMAFDDSAGVGKNIIPLAIINDPQEFAEQYHIPESESLPTLVDEVRQRIASHLARTIYISARADYADNYGPRYPVGVELFDHYANEATPDEVVEHTEELIAKIEEASGCTLVELFERAINAQPECGNDPSFDPFSLIDPFAYAIAMEANGAGVAWEDDYAPFERVVPNFPYTMDDLPADKFPINDEEK